MFNDNSELIRGKNESYQLEKESCKFKNAVNLKKVRLFKNGRSKAIRLPASYGYGDVETVAIYQDASGDVHITKRRLLNDYTILKSDLEKLVPSKMLSVEFIDDDAVF